VSEHRAQIRWSRQAADFGYETYPRAHTWRFEGGVEVAASAAPAFRGEPERVDPEQAFVASLASCHMLTFLAIAARRRLVVDTYEDAAVGFLEKNEEGRLAITRVVLHPAVRFAEPDGVAPGTLQHLHQQAHEHCFIANSVRTRIDVEPA
jgi:organic hydroperoxide reductase OsmC/OhrA